MTGAPPEALRLPGIRAWIAPAAPEAAAVRAALPHLANAAESFPVLPTHNRMNRVRRIAVPGAEGPFILKEGWCNPAYPWGRRFCRRVRLWTSMPAVRAMRLAAAFAAAGFAVLRPVACWKERRPGKGLCHFFLYPEVAARGSLADFVVFREDGMPVFRDFPAKTRDALAHALRKMHEAGFLHLDPAPGNVLLKPGAPAGPGEEDFVWIDVESLRQGRAGKAATRREKARRACSMDRLLRVFPPGELEAFAAAYAGDADPGDWIALFRQAARK